MMKISIFLLLITLNNIYSSERKGINNVFSIIIENYQVEIDGQRIYSITKINDEFFVYTTGQYLVYKCNPRTCYKSKSLERPLWESTSSSMYEYVIALFERHKK